MNLTKYLALRLILSLTILTLSLNSAADSLTVNKWLIVPGYRAEMPLFAETENIKGEKFTIDDLFKFTHFDLNGHYPAQNSIFPGSHEENSKWSVAETNDSGFIELQRSDLTCNETAWLAAYISTVRWMKAEIEISASRMAEVYLNGSSLGTISGPAEKNSGISSLKKNIEIPAGKHLLIVRTLIEKEDEGEWQVKGLINLPPYASASDASVEPDPVQGKNINHLLDGTKAVSASLSSDGKYYAVNFRRTLPPSDNSESWTEIKRVSDRRVVHSFRHATIQSFAWAPAGNIFSYRTNRDGKATIWAYDLENGTYYKLLEDIDDFGSYSWSPDGSFLIYSLSEKASGEDGDLKRLLGTRDRIPGYRTRHFLYRADLQTGIRERLTHGSLTTALHDISPCSRRILFSQSRTDYSERPYWKHDVFIMDLGTKRVDTLFSDLRWGVSGRFSPDGKKLLLTGGPSAFGSKGENIPEGMIANNYDTQAYIHDLENGVTDPFTREFDPSVSQAVWSKSDNNIYIVAEDEDFVHLFRYNQRNRRFTKIDAGKDVISWIRFAEKEPVAVYSGSGMSTPPRISVMNLKTGKYEDLENPDKENFKNVAFGNNLEWDFKNEKGVRIPGRVYLPPGFDKSKKYPLIVYYYGGTNPVSRSFGGRYPYNMYAANGYVVYVLQPSGATGFGQEFSAMHVNNWGITVADEIIEGTRLFLNDHPFIDPEKVGCMGASYGGFMTMLLQTRTDIFAAAISHAGISSISSYWGEGYWGYGYSAEASAESFPWNNADLYVGQSPLFSADKVKTPLLLLHGSSDTNVPPGESIQMYVALKLLGRPVELIEIKGEDHHILTYSKRIGWSNTILAWFDKWMKDQPEWWENLYPEKNY